MITGGIVNPWLLRPDGCSKYGYEKNKTYITIVDCKSWRNSEKDYAYCP